MRSGVKVGWDEWLRLDEKWGYGWMRRGKDGWEEGLRLDEKRKDRWEEILEFEIVFYQNKGLVV